MADSTAASYATSGFANKMGWGSRPALLLIDVCTAYWTAGSPLDTSANAESAAAPASMRKLVAAARAADTPVIWTNVSYDRPGMADAGLMYKKAKALTVWQKGDGRGLQRYVEGLVPDEGDVVVIKKMPSAFFGTTLAADLQLLNVDTLVICGVSTSGCVRASTLDAMQHGFRPMVVGSACGDRTPEIQRSNLFDMNAKYADVVSEAEAVEKLAIKWT
ncbi:N-carbamoylsarcosine amidase [Calycina marina]|uniref:N-carbamoylsarcosine amidase n=1 Tax=Calycina marina TaxID=1763456 RepID=A0A9P7Z835_9HELO|nr:N-carbamoylsarcosine amidase [Calycina marina]